jgi:hypothetical protein
MVMVTLVILFSLANRSGKQSPILFNTSPHTDHCSHHPPATAYAIINEKHGVEVRYS